MTNMATNARNVRIENRSRIAAQNLMEGDEVLMRGAPSVFVERIARSEARGTVTVTYSNGTRRKFEWDERVSIGETPQRHLYRRNSLRRNGYPNYLKRVLGEDVLSLIVKPKVTLKRKPKNKSRR